jgi:hypothetical protein
MSSLVLLLAAGLLVNKAHTDATILNIQAQDSWTFFQARSIRRSLASASDPSLQAGIRKQIDELQNKAQQVDSDELWAKAKHAEEMRDTAIKRYRHYFSALRILWLGLLFALATVVAGTTILTWTTGALNILGVALILIGVLDPTIIAAPVWLLFDLPPVTAR